MFVLRPGHWHQLQQQHNSIRSIRSINSSSINSIINHRQYTTTTTTTRKTKTKTAQTEPRLLVPQQQELDASSAIVVSRLSNREKQFFDMFKSVASHYGGNIHLRVSGGWVRDKLLTTTSANPKKVDDIDIAIDGITGREFVDLIERYRVEKGLSQQKYLIRSNPEKSKHLETAAIKIDGCTFDFTGLRAEDYDQHSRIPKISAGTLESDAHRRDITINALYFNLNTYMVEDYTGKGLDDLRKGIVRTPLEPMITLLEDPLRALRVIRFATRFNFQIHPALYKSLTSSDVRKSLELKVSKERIYVEFTSMMSSFKSGAIQYYRYLVGTGLVDAVFPFDSMVKQPVEMIPRHLEKEIILSSLLLPLYIKYGKSDNINMEQLLMDFKLPKKEIRAVLSIIQSQEIIAKSVSSMLMISPDTLYHPDQFETSLRPLLEWLRHNQYWQAGLWLSSVHFKLKFHSPDFNKDQFWIEFEKLIQNSLEKMANQQYCLDGHEIKDALSIPQEESKPITNIIDELLIWQWKYNICHDKITKDDAKHFVRGLWAQQQLPHQ
ncbi:hypothetical protein SAMD00019534_105510 [Acytostelium subglobosum LB1]|uniref:hypothetical protein n=1 Tax=Acytostelium subglobosum LB1 TaxID=1410327 RepID=UPI000644F573|nr:hypothetical protein SAMD00019534_105510 [Acytostelium subglobosum LB1]GAM27376.1 hypothetical protein SAMD00019534_105510 [Acytostelium subglobosum LB1]|eukprot:XP_012749843.1 hypothetical protein SAMD00019534_105510 [Acytostelium subglobosum LB1]